MKYHFSIYLPCIITFLILGTVIDFAPEVVEAAEPTQETPRVIEVKEGDDLNAALKKAQLGDQIVLDAGARFPGPIVLPNKPAFEGQGRSPWITIRTSKLSDLPSVGNRVAPEHAESMPTIYTDTSYPAITSEFRAHHYHFIGIEITTTSEKSYDLVRFGFDTMRGRAHATSIDQLPDKIVFERCYLHGSRTGDLRTGITMNTKAFAIFDSYISEVHERGAEAQALVGFNGIGPFKIVNNFLEAAGENVMFGGADPKIDQLVPSDILIERNYFFKPLRWKKGHPDYEQWVVKNILEFKSARRAVVRGNLFENCWPAGQSGKAILFTARNQNGGAPWTAVEDITFENNVLRNINGFIQIGSGGREGHSTKPLKNIFIRNNLMLNVAENNSKGIRSFFEIDGNADRPPTTNVKILHNVGLFVPGHGKSLMTLGSSGKVIDGLVFEKNIFSCGQFGVSGSGSTPGIQTINQYFRNWTFRDNILVGTVGQKKYPPDNTIVPGVTEVGFVDPAQGDFRLQNTSPGRKLLGTDNSPPGVDLELLQAWTAGVAEGRPPVVADE